MRVITETDLKKIGLNDINFCVDVMEKMYMTMISGEFSMGGSNSCSHGIRMNVPNKTELYGATNKKEDGLFIAMPSFLGKGFNKVGIKWHGPNIANASGYETKYTILLNDRNTGELLSIMPGNLLTTFRTAAISVLAAKYLMNNKVRVVSIIGPGKINTVILDGLLKNFNRIKKIKIKGKGKEKIEKLKFYIEKNYNQSFDIEIVDTYEQAVRDADIVSIVTGFHFEKLSDLIIIRDKWIKKGSLILSSSFINISDNFIINEAINVVDNFKMYEAYAKELGTPVYKELSCLGNKFVDLINEKKLIRKDVIELVDVIKNKELISDNNKTILFSSGGMGVEDLALATEMYNKVIEKNMGVNIELD